jgi:site-specific DNA-methyltransferase (adenine-specific)
MKEKNNKTYKDLFMGNCHLMLGDCLERMKEIPDNSIDCIVTDPPYKLTSGGRKPRENFNIVFNRTNYHDLSRGLMFNVPDFNQWLGNVYRILKNGTHFYCMTNDKNLNNIMNEALKVGFKEVNILVWDKGMHVPLPYYMKNIEFILLFRKGNARKINNMGSTSLIKIKGIYGVKVHPSEKPIKLMEHFILNSSNKNDIIFDPFMGSGTTGLACINTNRKFIGIELDEKYYDISCKRIKEAINEKKQQLF